MSTMSPVYGYLKKRVLWVFYNIREGSLIPYEYMVLVDRICYINPIS